jgi:hypothetical protein
MLRTAVVQSDNDRDLLDEIRSLRAEMRAGFISSEIRFHRMERLEVRKR